MQLEIILKSDQDGVEFPFCDANKRLISVVARIEILTLVISQKTVFEILFEFVFPNC